jgi:hypothetical protein
MAGESTNTSHGVKMLTLTGNQKLSILIAINYTTNGN